MRLHAPTRVVLRFEAQVRELFGDVVGQQQFEQTVEHAPAHVDVGQLHQIARTGAALEIGVVDRGIDVAAALGGQFQRVVQVCG